MTKKLAVRRIETIDDIRVTTFNQLMFTVSHYQKQWLRIPILHKKIMIYKG